MHALLALCTNTHNLSLSTYAHSLTHAQPTHVEVIDVSDGCGSSFEVVVVSDAFEGKATLARHRLVNSALAHLMPRIHSFTQRTFTPAQWAEKNP